MNIMNVEITPQQDAFQWRVVYQDGTHTDEYDGERTEGRGFTETLPKPIKEVWLTPWGPFDECLYRVLMPEGASPVFFRRRRIELNPIDEVAEHSTTHCIGWTRKKYVIPASKLTDTGETESYFIPATEGTAHGTIETEGVYLFVFADGSTLLTSDLQAV